LKGGAADEVLEIARATIPNAEWDQGLEVVNAQIKGWREERRILRHVTADEPEQSAVALTAR
jgi:hypothetical protein